MTKSQVDSPHLPVLPSETVLGPLLTSSGPHKVQRLPCIPPVSLLSGQWEQGTGPCYSQSPQTPKDSYGISHPWCPSSHSQSEAEDWGHAKPSKCEARDLLLPRLETPGSTLTHPVTKVNGIYTGSWARQGSRAFHTVSTGPAAADEADAHGQQG